MKADKNYVAPQLEILPVCMEIGFCISGVSADRGIDGLGEDNSSESYIWN